MRRYKLRAGAMQDVLHFIFLCSFGNCENYEIVSNQDKQDVTLEFDSPLALDELRAIVEPLREQELMLQTLDHLENYTGNYSK